MTKLLPFLLFIALFAGCGTLDKSGAYAGDETLYRADLTIATSYDLLHEFVSFEYQNRAALASTPAVTKYADNVRAHARQWIGSAVALRQAYKADPSAANKAALQASIDILRTALTEATGYLAAAPAPATPAK